MPMLEGEGLELRMGQALKRYRLQQNEEQRAVARRAGVSLRALGNLENGGGSSLRTFVRVVAALGREDWLGSLAPEAAGHEVCARLHSAPRQRARRSPRADG